jgi:DNA topoisomerase-1
MSKLLIVESPAKAKTIGKYLGKNFRVIASIGHIRDLPKSNKNAVDIAAGFAPRYEIVKGKEKIVEEISEAARAAEEVILATDADREGEAIAWHIAEILKNNKVKTPVKRVVYYEITKNAITESLRHPRAIDQNLRRAQEARRVLDRLVGYELSGLIWKKIRYGLSAGRVQSPALRILVERERERKSFRPETFWVITASLQTASKEKIVAVCEMEPRDQAIKEKIIAAAKNNWFVKEVVEIETRRKPRAPFTTSTLQQAASTRLGFSPSRTMRAAQKLYEAGLITYMRTDSTHIAENARQAILEVINKKFGSEFASPHIYTSKIKNAQEAHEAIRPTNISKETIAATNDQRQLYQLIWQRTLASQMTDAKIWRTKIITSVGADTPDFIANGSRLIFPGWLIVDPAARGQDTELPKVTKGDKLTLIELNETEKQTEPPPRYTEAGLIKELEKRGIGRPSTYASIVDTIKKRGYVELEGRSLRPTDTGEVVSNFLEENFNQYISDTFTAEMENKLDEIANGKLEYKKTLADFYQPFAKVVKSRAKISTKLTSLGVADFHCPICGAQMEWKLSRFGKFLSCLKFPSCEGALTAEGKPLVKGDKPIGIHPENGEPIFVKNGRFGPYVQLGEGGKGKNKPKMASIPKEIEPASVTIEQAVKLLSLPRVLGVNPQTGKEIIANRGRFGPYIAEDGDFRSLKLPDNPYDITLSRALSILAETKKTSKKSRRGSKK